MFCDLVGLFKCFSGWTQGCSERAKRSSSTLAVMFSRHPSFWELWERAEHLCRPAFFCFRVFRGFFCVELQGLYGVVTVYLVLSCTLKAIWSCEIFYKDMNPKYSANPCDLLMCLWSIRAAEEWICWRCICRFSSVSVDYFFIRWFFANVLQASPTESEPSISGAALRWSLDANFVLYLITHELYQQKFRDPLKVLASFSTSRLRFWDPKWTSHQTIQTIINDPPKRMICLLTTCNLRPGVGSCASWQQPSSTKCWIPVAFGTSGKLKKIQQRCSGWRASQWRFMANVCLSVQAKPRRIICEGLQATEGREKRASQDFHVSGFNCLTLFVQV